jgi:hypothetical protein
MRQHASKYDPEVRITGAPIAERRTRSKWLSHVANRIPTIQAWKRAGLTDEEIAKNLGVAWSTFKVYKATYPALMAALKTGKSDADAQVENALFKRACGYDYEEVETTVMKSKDGSDIIPRIKKVRKQVAPDITAQIFYLKNRCYDRWRDRTALEHSGPDGGPMVTGKVVLYLPDNGRLRKKQEQAQNDDAAAGPEPE